MAFIGFSDGQVLTAGSITLIPVVHSMQTFADVSVGSTAAYQTLGSAVLAASDFTERLFIQCGWVSKESESTSSTQIVFSGASYSGGSEVFTKTHTRSVSFPTAATHNYGFEIASGAGWVPGEQTVIFLKGRTNKTNDVAETPTLSVWGKGGY